MEKHINSCFEANREYIKCEKMIFIFEKREDFDNNLAITTLKNWQLKNHLQVYYIPE